MDQCFRSGILVPPQYNPAGSLAVTILEPRCQRDYLECQGPLDGQKAASRLTANRTPRVSRLVFSDSLAPVLGDGARAGSGL